MRHSVNILKYQPTNIKLNWKYFHCEKHSSLHYLGKCDCKKISNRVKNCLPWFLGIMTRGRGISIYCSIAQGAKTSPAPLAGSGILANDTQTMLTSLKSATMSSTLSSRWRTFFIIFCNFNRICKKELKLDLDQRWKLNRVSRNKVSNWITFPLRSCPLQQTSLIKPSGCVIYSLTQ